jgi:hypothetical protein
MKWQYHGRMESSGVGKEMKQLRAGLAENFPPFL